MKTITKAIVALSALLLCSCSQNAPVIGAVSPTADPLAIYREIAADKGNTQYPPYNEFAQASFNGLVISIPSAWKISKPNNPEQAFLNESNAVAGNSYIQTIDTANTKYLGLMPNHSELLDMKKLDGFSSDVYELSYVQTQPAEAADDTATVHLAVCVIDKSGQTATCFDFIKAVANGDKVQYLVSNQVISQIEKSIAITK